jgi:hypothetical protein
LRIPLDLSRSVLVGAEQGIAAGFLHTLADVLTLQCQDPDDSAQCRAVLASDRLPAGERGPQFRKVVRETEYFKVFPLINGFADHEQQAVLMRFLFCGAITLENLHFPGEFFLFHGSLLEDGKDAVLLFGESGIGKSTTRRRWLSEGGSSTSDDAMLCFFDGNDLYARCLPTWSDWSMNGSFSRRYPAAEPRRIKSILWLSRGKESQYISQIPPAVWHAQMMSALMVHAISPVRRFSDTEKTQYLNNIWNFICKVDKKFAPRGLFAHLDFPLKPTLAQEFSK